MSISTTPHALSAAHYADNAVWAAAEITEHVPLTRETYRLRFRAPEIARRIAPGQFVMLRLAGFDDPLLGRALALFDVATNAASDTTGTVAANNVTAPTDVDVVYMVVGKLTRRLTAFKPGQQLEVWGPLGNGFPTPATNHLVLAAGGVGITPFLAVAKQFLGRQYYGPNPAPSPQPPAPVQAPAPRVTLCYGVRSANYFAAVEQFEQLGVDVRLSTDDGSHGHHGRVTDVLADVLAKDLANRQSAQIPASSAPSPQPPAPRPQPPAPAPQVFCCGPEPMMEAVAKVCRTAAVRCHVSLETPMACGVGICFTCVAKVRQPDGEWDYKRTCVEGPIFDAQRIVWD